MKKSIHGKTMYRSNLATDLRIANYCGFNGIEIVTSKLVSFLEQYTSDDLNILLKKYGVQPVCINDIAHVETDDNEKFKQILKTTHKLCKIAQEISCPYIQLVPLMALEGRAWTEIRDITGSNIRKMADIAADYGISFQMEPVAWSPIYSLSKCLEMMKAADRPNIKMGIDFWHLWAGGETSPNEVAALDKSMICNIHFCDGKKQPRDTVWDETILRGYYPGEGDIPINKWVEAVRATGYDGFWSCELVSAKHWEEDVFLVAESMSKAMDKYIFS